MKLKVKQFNSDSYCLEIPSDFLNRIGVSAGDEIFLEIQDNSIILYSPANETKRNKIILDVRKVIDERRSALEKLK